MATRAQALKTALSFHKKSKIVKKVKKGHDFSKKNVPGKTGFNVVADKATKEYGSAEVGKKVAAAAFWKMQRNK